VAGSSVGRGSGKKGAAAGSLLLLLLLIVVGVRVA